MAGNRSPKVMAKAFRVRAGFHLAVYLVVPVPVGSRELVTRVEALQRGLLGREVAAGLDCPAVAGVFSDTGIDVRIDGWDIRGRWFGIVVGATLRLGELPRGETIPWRVIAAQMAPRERRGSC